MVVTFDFILKITVDLSEGENSLAMKNNTNASSDQTRQLILR